MINLKDRGIKNIADTIGVIPMVRKDLNVIDLSDNNINLATR